MSSTMPGPKFGQRKANFSLPEIRCIVDGLKEHLPYLDSNWTNGSRYQKSEVWQDIYDKYHAKFPDSDRTALDIRKKLIKLRSQAKRLYQRETLRDQGEDIDKIVSEPSLKLAMTPAHKYMLQALEPDFADQNVADSEFVEYEMELDDSQVQDDNDEDDVEYQGVCSSHRVYEEVDQERIIKQLFLPGGTLKLPICKPKREPPKPSEPQKKKRKGEPEANSPLTSVAQEILDLQKQKLELERNKVAIECDNLLLVQQKLKLDVTLLERKLMDYDRSVNTSGSNGKGGDGRENDDLGNASSSADVNGKLNGLPEGEESVSAEETGTQKQ